MYSSWNIAITNQLGKPGSSKGLKFEPQKNHPPKKILGAEIWRPKGGSFTSNSARRATHGPLSLSPSTGCDARCPYWSCGPRPFHSAASCCFYVFSEVMLMEEIPNNPPGVYETLYIYHINWCRISAIKRIFTYIYISSIICYSLLPCSSVSLTVGSLLFGSVLGSGQEWIICRHEMDAHTHTCLKAQTKTKITKIDIKLPNLILKPSLA